MLRTNRYFALNLEDQDTSTETVRQVLWAMRRAFVELGWCQGSWAKTDDPSYPGDCEPTDDRACRFCLGGVIGFVLNEEWATNSRYGVERPSPLALKIREILSTTLYERDRNPIYNPADFPDPLDILIEWNDANPRTIEDIVALIDESIDSLPAPVQG